MAKDSHSVVSSIVAENPAPESSSSGAGAPDKKQERIRRIESSLDSVSAIVADKRQDWSDFLAEDNGAGAKPAKDRISALITVYPE